MTNLTTFWIACLFGRIKTVNFLSVGAIYISKTTLHYVYLKILETKALTIIVIRCTCNIYH